MGPVTLGQERLAANLWSSTRGIRSYIHNWEHDEAKLESFASNQLVSITIILFVCFYSTIPDLLADFEQGLWGVA